MAHWGATLLETCCPDLSGVLIEDIWLFWVISKVSPPGAKAKPPWEGSSVAPRLTHCQSAMLISLHFPLLYASLPVLSSFTQHTPITRKCKPRAFKLVFHLANRNCFGSSYWLPIVCTCQLCLVSLFHSTFLQVTCHICVTHLVLAGIWLPYPWHKFCVTLSNL